MPKQKGVIFIINDYDFENGIFDCFFSKQVDINDLFMLDYYNEKYQNIGCFADKIDRNKQFNNALTIAKCFLIYSIFLVVGVVL